MNTEGLATIRWQALLIINKTDRKVGRKMILQYEMNEKEVYREADMVAFAEVLAAGKKFADVNDIITQSNNQLNYTPETVEIASDCLSDKEKIKEIQSVKMAILSDGMDKKKNVTLLFDSEAQLYLLNNNGKTIKRF